MEYIQCTHCGKRYEVSDQIRAAEGQFTTCQACSEKFLIVVHSGKKKTSLEEDDSVISTDGWDPSLTMPTESQEVAAQEKAVREEYIDDDDDGAEVLLALQVARKKKKTLYTIIGLAICALLGGAWFVLQEDTPQHTGVSQQATKVVVKSVKDKDAANPECRKQAAMQWLLDYKVMHASYSGDAFVRMVNASEKQSAKVRKVCGNKEIIQNIITAATRKEKPSWFQAEIEVIQANRKR